MHFAIREPIWKGRQVGLHEDKLEADNEVEVLYEQKDGTRLFPYTYTITKQKAMQYPVQRIKSGQRLRIVPIVELEIKHG